MHPISLTLSLLLLGASLSSQNFITNGDFSAGLTGWTLGGGYSCTPGLETFDVGGLGPVPCFACGPGGLVTPPPYPANTLEQPVLFVPTLEYELTADILTKNENPTTTVQNVDAGRIRVDVNGTPVGSYNFSTGAGNIPGQSIWRAKLVLRFVSTATGTVPLTFNFERSFLCNTTTPRVRITNIALRLAGGLPTFSITDNLRLGRTVNLQVQGAAAAPFAVFIAHNLFVAPVQIPGVIGLFYLDLLTVQTFWSGMLDPSGLAKVPLLIPNDPYLTFAPTWFQPAEITGGQASLGSHHYFVFTSF